MTEFPEDASIVEGQVLIDAWPMRKGEVAKEDGQFVAGNSWRSLTLERHDKALKVHELGQRPTWELVGGLLGLALLVGYLVSLLDKRLANKSRVTRP